MGSDFWYIYCQDESCAIYGTKQQSESMSAVGVMRVFVLCGIPRGKKVSVNPNGNFWILLSSPFKDNLFSALLNLFSAQTS